MKKIFLLLATVLCALSLVACMNSGDESESSSIGSSESAGTSIESSLQPQSSEEEFKLETPTNIQVSQSGILSFTSTEEADVNCYLYVGSQYVGTVENGCDIKEYLSVGVNSIQLELNAVSGSDKSQKSDAVEVEVNAVAENVSISSDFVITFTVPQGKKAILFNTGEKVGEIESGADLSDLISSGVNDFSIVVQSEGDVDSAEVSVTFTVHKKIDDIKVTVDGIIEFSSYYGYEYVLVVDDEEVGKVESGDEISKFALTEGEHVINVKIVLSGDLMAISELGEAITVEKYAPVSDISIDEGIISFTEVTGAEHRLYINGEFVDVVTDGSEARQYFTVDGEIEMSIETVPTAEGFVKSEMSEPYLYEVPRYADIMFKAVNGEIKVESGASIEDAPDGLSKGVKVTAAASEKSFVFAKTFDLNNTNGSILKFRTLNNAESSPVGGITVRITDVDDAENEIVLNFYRNGDSDASNQIYINPQYKTYESYENKGRLASVDYVGKTTTVSKFVNIKYDASTQTFDINGRKIQFGGEEQSIGSWGGNSILGPGTEITGFANGATITIEFDYLESESGILIQNIAGYQYADGVFLTKEENPTTAIIRDTGALNVVEETVMDGLTGLKVASSSYGYNMNETLFTTERVDFMGLKGESLIKLRTLNTYNGGSSYLGMNGGADGATSLTTISIIDVEDPTNVITVSLISNVAATGARSVYVQFAYGDYATSTTSSPAYTRIVNYACDFYAYGGVDDRYFDLRFDGQTGLFVHNCGVMNLAELGHPISGFENGAYIAVGYSGWVNRAPGFFVTELGGKKWEAGKGFGIEEAKYVTKIASVNSTMHTAYPKTIIGNGFVNSFGEDIMDGNYGLKIASKTFGYTSHNPLFTTESFDLLGLRGESVIKFRTMNFHHTGSNSGLGMTGDVRTTTIKIIDVDNADNVLTVTLYSNADSKSVYSVYVNFAYGSYSTTENAGAIKEVACNFYGDHATYERYFDLRFNAETGVFTHNCGTFNLAENGITLTGFENGAYISVSYAGGATGRQSGYFITTLGGVDWTESKGFI